MEILRSVPGLLLLFLSFTSLAAQSTLPPEYMRVQQSPHSPRALFDLGEYYYRQEDYARALPLYLLALTNGKKDAWLFIKLGRCYNKLDHPEQALPVFKRGIQLYPSHSTLLISLAHCHYLLGHYNTSVSLWKKSLGSGANNPSQYGFVYAGIAKAYREMGQYTNSQNYFLRSLSYKKDFWLCYEYAKLLENMDLPLEAAHYYGEARTLEKKQDWMYQVLIREKEAGIYYRLAMQYKKQKDWKQALSSLQKILDEPELHQTSSHEKALFWIKRISLKPQ